MAYVDGKPTVGHYFGTERFQEDGVFGNSFAARWSRCDLLVWAGNHGLTAVRLTSMWRPGATVSARGNGAVCPARDPSTGEMLVHKSTCGAE